ERDKCPGKDFAASSRSYLPDEAEQSRPSGRNVPTRRSRADNKPDLLRTPMAPKPIRKLAKKSNRHSDTGASPTEPNPRNPNQTIGRNTSCHNRTDTS